MIGLNEDSFWFVYRVITEAWLGICDSVWSFAYHINIIWKAWNQYTRWPYANNWMWSGWKTTKGLVKRMHQTGRTEKSFRGHLPISIIYSVDLMEPDDWLFSGLKLSVVTILTMIIVCHKFTFKKMLVTEVEWMTFWKCWPLSMLTFVKADLCWQF